MNTRRDKPGAPLPLVAAYVSVAAVLSLTHAVTTDQNVADWSYTVSVALFPIACLLSWRYLRPARSIWLMAFSMAGSFLVASIAESVGGEESPLSLSIVENLALFVGQLLLVAALIACVHRRRGRLVSSTLADASIVAITGWMVVYVWLVQPTIENSSDPVAITMLEGLYQPLGIASVFLLALLLYAETFRSPAVWFLAGVILFSLVGDLVYALEAAGSTAGHQKFGDIFYLLAYLSGGGVLLHPSIHSLAERIPVGEPRSSTSRLLFTTSCMIVPIAILALGEPESTSDRIIRFVSALAIAAAIITRVVVTLRAAATAHRKVLAMAQHDALTGLPNRVLLSEQITGALHHSWRSNTRPTVLFIDLDRFKNINDSLGHAVGDEVLRLVGRRLRLTLPDQVIVGRVSGDEFMAIDPNARSTGDAMAFADKVLSVFREPFHVGAGDLYVTASIGLAVANSVATAEELHRNSDTAMYRAKEAGRNCVAMFDDSMHERVAHRLQIESALHRALDRRELHLYYQPIVDVATTNVVGFEALMRWQMSDGRIVSPVEFIPIAEETGLIVSIGSWAMLEALTQLDNWIRDGVCGPDATMSVNVSPRQLRDPHLLSAVSEALLRSTISPEGLWLEITEGVMISEPEQALAVLRRLRALGVRIAIDDFGTGYSSLSHLRRFPLQRIKIDRAFIAGVAEDESSRSLVRTIIAMADSLGLDVVAEGVESQGQLRVLAALECSKAQGYLLSIPVPGDAMRQTLEDMRRMAATARATQPVPEL